MDAAESITGSTAGSSARPVPDSDHEPQKSGGSSDEAAADEAVVDGATALTERERAILAFEQQWWKYPGKKEQAIRELFGMSATRYYQILNRLMESQAAMAADPMLVKRLRKTRASRSRARAARRLGTEL